MAGVLTDAGGAVAAGDAANNRAPAPSPLPLAQAAVDACAVGAVWAILDNAESPSPSRSSAAAVVLVALPEVFKTAEDDEEGPAVLAAPKSGTVAASLRDAPSSSGGDKDVKEAETVSPAPWQSGSVVST